MTIIVNDSYRMENDYGTSYKLIWRHEKVNPKTKEKSIGDTVLGYGRVPDLLNAIARHTLSEKDLTVTLKEYMTMYKDIVDSLFEEFGG